MKCIGAMLLTFLLAVFQTCQASAEEWMEFGDIYAYLEASDANPNIPSYAEYSKGHDSIAADEIIRIEAAGGSVSTNDEANAHFEFSVKEAGNYAIKLAYYPLEGASAEIQRAILIDGKLPFRELSLVAFSRVWRMAANNGSWAKDSQGNDLMPEMVEEAGWRESFAYDSQGYANDPLQIFLSPGNHSISIITLREPALIGSVSLIPLNGDFNEPPYALSTQSQPVGTVVIEAEEASRTSSQTLFPLRDVSSPGVSPISPKLLLNNAIGGAAFSTAGQWIEWDFDIADDGWYVLDLNVKQNYKRGMVATRKIEIDGSLPDEKFSAVKFGYKQNWRVETVADESGMPLKFHLAPGKHTIRMEVALGDFAEVIRRVQTCISGLNAVYRKVMRLTGANPDPYRDYQIEANLPELAGEFNALRVELDEILSLMDALGGSQGERSRELRTMRDQLEDYAVDADKASRTLSSYKSNISACGEWIADATDQPLAIDRMMLRSSDAPKMQVKNGFWDGAAFEIKRFFYSYIVDYTKIGNTSNDAGTLTLWVGSGRDQAGAIKQLLEESFTPATGVKVNLQLVDMGTLLQAVMSGQGPDAAFQVGEATNSLTYGQRYGQMSVDLPVNYGLRGAVADLRMFEDFEAVSNRFAESALTSMEFGGACYALPETQSFPVMFYRKDILAELNLALPQTWEDVEKAIAVMARNQMVFGLAPSEQTFATFLFQCGGSYYNADATASALSEPAAIRAFKAYCEYFTDYRLDKELGSGATGGGLSQRFRTGEAPIAIADFGLYNELQVSAPELRGLWGIGLVPGTEVEGRIDRSVACGGTSCIILNASKNKSEAWELLKWWTSKETQTRYARQMESLMGAAARVPASNLEAFDSLPWPAKDLITLNEQREFAKGIQQAPGGYITYRNVNNAFFLATVGISSPIGGVDGNKTLSTPEEALTDKVILIDEEIAYKAMEFNLDSATS